MKKADMSREYSKWESLHRDILVIIFGKLNLRDLNEGASRVCISWFLAAHNKTLWSTVDLDKVYQVEEGLSLWNILNKLSKFFFDVCQVRKSLTNITRFSGTAPKNLFFSYNSYLDEGDLMFAAVRMPNIEKLALPYWRYYNKDTVRCAFSTWKNLKTLIIGQQYFDSDAFDFQAVGDSCSNLINLKFLGYLSNNNADQIVRYLPNLKRLSLRGSLVSTRGVLLWLITGLQNLKILNLSHCRKFGPYDDYPVRIGNDLQDATQKLENFIICSQDCKLCKTQNLNFNPVSWSKHWKNDEIHELDF